MKAWVVTSDVVEVSVIVFAETRGRAKTLALKTDWLHAEDYADLRCRRESRLDAMAQQRGETVIDGSSPTCQRTMRGLGWYEIEGRYQECGECGLHEWDQVPESQLTDTGEGYICAGCLDSKK